MTKKSANWVAGVFSPPAPTTPRMRVRTGRFPESFRTQSNLRMCSRAGYNQYADILAPPIGFIAMSSMTGSSLLSKVKPFAMSRVLPRAFDYYGLC